MTLQAFTASRDSFERTSQAIEAVGEYFATRQRGHLNKAGAAVEDALRADQNYGLAVFYRGIIHDLAGTPADAVPFFQRILSESGDASMVQKARFNLGVAYYHQYTHQWLELAAQHFEGVEAESSDVRLKGLARAHLAQVHAMWMRPSSRQTLGAPETRAHIDAHFQKSNKYASAIVDDSNATAHERAVALNALGMSHMYITDYVVTNPPEKLKSLNKAKSFLDDVAKTLPDDWANTCDLASVNLRLGVLAKQQGRATDAEVHFENAKTNLDLVIQRLRPGYGFALHEMGILHRVWEKWDEATKFFRRAKAVPVRYRDIGDDKNDKEMAAAHHRDATYPLT